MMHGPEMRFGAAVRSCQTQMADLGWMPERTSSSAERPLCSAGYLRDFIDPVRTSRQQPVKTL
jgi:hypothetical protein